MYVATAVREMMLARYAMYGREGDGRGGREGGRRIIR